MQRIIFLMVFVLGAVNVFAAHPLITDDTGTQGRGKFQLELNGEWGRDSDDGIVDSGEIAASITSGLADKLDLVLGIPFAMEKPKNEKIESGVGDLSVELKWNFYEINIVSFALKPGVTFPSGDWRRGFGTGLVGCSGYFVTTIQPEPVAIHFNLGYIRNENKNDDYKDIWHVSFALEYAVIKDKLRIVTNTGVERNSEREGNEPPCFVLLGLVWSPVEFIDLDIGYKYGATKPEADHALMAGFTVRW